MTDITYVSWHQTATVLPLIQNWSSAQLSLWPFSSKFWKILTVIIKISWKQDFTATGVVYHRDQWTWSRTHRLPIHLWHSCHLVILSSCHPVIIWLNILQHFQWAIDKVTWARPILLFYYLSPPHLLRSKRAIMGPEEATNRPKRDRNGLKRAKKTLSFY